MYIENLSQEMFERFAVTQIKNEGRHASFEWCRLTAGYPVVLNCEVDTPIWRETRFFEYKFTDFSCEILDKSNNTQKVYNKQWAEYVATCLSAVEETKHLTQHYKQDYNNNRKMVKNYKYSQVDKEYEESLIK